MSKKKECSECHRILRTIHFVFNPVEKREMCRRCSNKIGNNKWYVPKEKRKFFRGRVSKYNFSDEEKSILRKAGRSWKDINSSIKYLRSRRNVNKQKAWDEKKKIKEKVNKDSEAKRKLIEGLKEYAKREKQKR